MEMHVQYMSFPIVGQKGQELGQNLMHDIKLVVSPDMNIQCSQDLTEE